MPIAECLDRFVARVEANAPGAEDAEFQPSQFWFAQGAFRLTRRRGSTKAIHVINFAEGFPAIVESSARVLILGSLPGAMSIERQQYYAKPQNVFWQIMGTLIGAGPELPYAERIQVLTKARIALWDVCASADRIGSLDSSIKNHTVNDFAGFFVTHPTIHLVCFNGQKAAAIYRRVVLDRLPQNIRRLDTKVLPSTSPANASMPYEERLRHWSSILPVCRLN